ncbi:MAG TPA: hypothetical protein VHZ55_18050 [Bryobacteraceae bacterium]|nr:hypothetical protein [Bryobacteraceae bacterium]
MAKCYGDQPGDPGTRRCEFKEIERLDAPSPLPPPESFMDTLDPIYSSLPTCRLLDETMRGELRVLLAQEARRWVEEDCLLVAQLRSTWRSHGALADHSYGAELSLSAFKE